MRDHTKYSYQPIDGSTILFIFFTVFGVVTFVGSVLTWALDRVRVICG